MRKYLQLCELFDRLGSLQSRNQMSLELAQYLKECDSEEVQIVSYMIQGRVAPMFVNSEFNYSEKSIVNLLSQKYSLDVGSMRLQSGDIGDTLFEIITMRPNTLDSLSIKEVYEGLWKIVNVVGTGSVTVKDKIILEYLAKFSPLEAKYFVRTICGQLRLGLSMKSLLDAFSIGVAGDKSIKPELENAYGVCADIGYIGKKLVEVPKEKISESISSISAQPGTPILSRLVQRVGGFDELFERFKEKVILQPKFDGLRCQIHKWEESSDKGDETGAVIWKKFKKNSTKETQNLFEINNISKIQVKLFTRNLEDVTEMFPEIVETAKKIEKTSFILDSEIVGWDYREGKILSYQETMQRRRKYSVRSKQEDIPVKAFAFDLLYLDSQSLVNIDTKERIKLLDAVLGSTVLESIVVAESKSLSKQEDVKGYFDKCIEEGLEGVIVKQEEGGYKPGVRNYEWIKIKKSINQEMVDTVDMVVVGYYKGSGRRASLGVGAILGAIYNEKRDTFDAICKIGTGMGDELLKEINTKLQDIQIKDMSKNVKVVDNLIPDVWVLPKYVITVDADEITKNISGKNESIGRGFSLRFPRLVEFDRDKGVEDITTAAELESMYIMRKSV